MGIARRVAVVGAIVGLVAAAPTGAGPPAPASAVVGTLLGGAALMLGGRRWPMAATGVAAVGAAPLLVAAIHAADAEGWVVLAACCLLISLRKGVLPRGVPFVVVGLGVVEALRACAAAKTLPVAAGPAAPLVLAGLGAGGASALPHAPRSLGAGLLIAGVAAGASRLQPPAGTVVDAVARARVGLSGDPGPALANQLAFLAAHPSAHGVATDVAETHGMALALEAGWRPDGAALPPEARIEAAAWLHGRGRGGEGRRLLHAGRGDARVAWWWTLAVRMEGLPSPEARHLQAPPEAFRLPGGFSVGETLLTDGLREWLVDVESECALALTAWGDPWNGPPRLSLAIDGSALPMWALPLQPAARSLGRLAPGPHRVTARFDNDAAGSDGDRNVHLLGFSCAND